jgi:hypothetical protein
MCGSANYLEVALLLAVHMLVLELPEYPSTTSGPLAYHVKAGPIPTFQSLSSNKDHFVHINLLLFLLLVALNTI